MNKSTSQRGFCPEDDLSNTGVSSDYANSIIFSNFQWLDYLTHVQESQQEQKITEAMQQLREAMMATCSYKERWQKKANELNEHRKEFGGQQMTSGQIQDAIERHVAKSPQEIIEVLDSIAAQIRGMATKNVIDIQVLTVLLDAAHVLIYGTQLKASWKKY